MIMDELENGNVPWRKGWNSHGYLPTSMTTGKPYTGINSLILSVVASRKNYTRGLWLTYKQAQALGGSVCKGEKGTHIVYYKMMAGADKNGEPTTFPLMRSYVVFNLDQCENIATPAKYLEKGEPVEVIPALESIIKGFAGAPAIYYSEQGRAYYDPKADSITLPSLAQFHTAEEHAYTLAHELTHSTGHSSRLNRWSEESEKPSKYGCDSYAREELVAELGACMILSASGITVDIPNSSAYVKNWLGALKNDKTLVFKASAKASKAMQHIIGAQVQEEVDA
jgi:antirestriction protein ArdC